MIDARWTQIAFASFLLCLGSTSCSSTPVAGAADSLAELPAELPAGWSAGHSPRVEARISEASARERGPDSFWRGVDYMVKGRVLDAAGEPLAAKVALVGSRGSSSLSVDGQPFELGSRGDFPRTLCAWTPDGRIGWSVLTAADIEEEVTVGEFQEGAHLTVVAGGHNDRVSIDVDGVPIHNVKFPAGESLTFVVPAREISFGTVGTETHKADRRLVRLAPGEAVTVTF